MANRNNGYAVDPTLETCTPNLWPVPGTAYNLIGYRPVSSVFSIDKQTLEDDILGIIKKFSKDFVMVRFETDPRTHQISLWAWITKNSRDIVDTRYQNRDDLIIDKPMLNLSENMRRLQNMFGIPNDKNNEVQGDPSSEENVFRKFRFVKPANGDPRFLGTQLDMNAVLMRIFDVEDKYYKKLYDSKVSNNDPKNPGVGKKSYKLEFRTITNKSGNVTHFVIVKNQIDSGRMANLHPKQAHRLSSDD